jgi:hypothetical protein
MLYLSLFLFLLCGWLLPWWCLALMSFALGIFLRGSAWKVGAAAALAWAGLAYILDGRSHGLISQRMSGLFGMPAPYFIFVLMAAMGGITATLFFKAGGVLNQIKYRGPVNHPAVTTGA